MRHINIQIVQPAVPRYRKPLFDAICSHPRLSLTVSASRTEPSGVQSVRPLPAYVDSVHHTLSLFRGRAFWQRGLKLSPRLRGGDILVINGNLRYLSNFPLWLHATVRRVRVVWWGHLRSPTTRRTGLWLRLILMRGADSCLLYTEREARELAIRGMNPDRLCFLNNTVDTRAIRTARQDVTAGELQRFKQRNNLGGKRVLAFVGRLRADHSTDLDTAIVALSFLHTSEHAHTLLVIGDGPDRPRLQALARRYGVEEDVRFVGAVFDESILALWLGSADVFVYPGTIGLSLLTAFAYALPVVTHNELRHHGPEISALSDGNNGELFNRGDARDLAVKIEQIYETLGRYRSEATATAYGPFAFERMVERFVRCMESTAGRRYPGHGSRAVRGATDSVVG